MDDDPDIRELVKLALETVGGFIVTQLASGTEALEIAHKIDADLFLFDVMMPEISGPETLARLRAYPRLSEIPAVFLTATAAPKDLEELNIPGVAAVIAKPFDPITLPDTLIQILHSFVPPG